MAAVITPDCILYAASLARPIAGWFLLSVTFCQAGATFIRKMLRDAMVLEFGAIGKKAALPLTDLGDGRWLLRFVSRERPPLVSPEGLELIVQPASGSVLRVHIEPRPMRSHVGIIPIMQRVVVLQFIASNRGTPG